MEDNILPQRTGFVELEPELTVLQGGTPWLRLRISDGGRPYVVKSLEELLSHIENNQVVSYGKSLAFQHRWDAFTPEARQLLNLLRREIINRQQLETRGYTTSRYAAVCRSVCSRRWARSKGWILTTSTARIPSGGWIVRPPPGCCLRSGG